MSPDYKPCHKKRRSARVYVIIRDGITIKALIGNRHGGAWVLPTVIPGITEAPITRTFSVPPRIKSDVTTAPGPVFDPVTAGADRVTGYESARCGHRQDAC